MERYPIQGYWLLLYGVPTAFVTATVNDAMCTKYSKHKLDVVMLRPVCWGYISSLKPQQNLLTLQEHIWYKEWIKIMFRNRCTFKNNFKKCYLSDTLVFLVS